MSYGLLAATLLQTLSIFTFVFIMAPFRIPVKRAIGFFSIFMLALSCVACFYTVRYGVAFMLSYGHWFIGLPAFLFFFVLSQTKGIRFVFVFLTTQIFYQIISILLMVLRVYQNGYTFLYFAANILLFGALIYGGYYLRGDFHKIVFTYKYEFYSLCPILLLLFGLIWVCTPLVEPNTVDTDMLWISIVFYLLAILLYVYVGVNFRSLSRRCDAERDMVSLRHQTEEAQKHIAMLRGFEERSVLHRHDMRHHLALISEFLEKGELEKLRTYLVEAQKEVEKITPERYCQNEAANLILASFVAKAKKAGVGLQIEAEIPHSLAVGNTELCALLSNALENAIAAASQVKDKDNTIRGSVRMVEGKLLLMVENPYSGTVQIENGLPQSNRKGHGFGTKSMAAIVNNYAGLYSFEARDGIFTLRIAI